MPVTIRNIVWLLIWIPLVANAETEVYVGGGLGAAYVDNSLTIPGAIFVTDDDDIGFRLFGGYWFTQNIAMELGYVDFGDLDNAVTVGGDGLLFGGTEIDGVYGAINGRLQFTDAWYLQAHAGLIAWDAEFSGVSFDTGVSFEDDGEDLFYGIDIGRRLGDQFEVRGGFTRYQIDDLDVDFISVDLIWNVDYGAR